MLTAACHCGAVRLTVPRKPRSFNNCQCSICRRYGALWAYYQASTVRVEAKPGATETYAWGRKNIRFVRCAGCGCVMYWERVAPSPDARMGVNGRNFEPGILGSVRLRHLDGASGRS